MKRILILLTSLIVGLSVYSVEGFDTLNVDVPCNIKIFKTDGYLVRVLNKNGKPSKNVTWEIKDSVLQIKGFGEDANETTVVVFAPNDQKILIDTKKYDLKETE